MAKFSMSPKTGPTEHFFKHAIGYSPRSIFEKWGKMGVSALAAATPRETGKTAESWRYEIQNARGNWSLTFFNDNVVNYVKIAIIIQYGHATRGGTFVPGVDYINPAITPIFDGLEAELNKELDRL